MTLHKKILILVVVILALFVGASWKNKPIEEKLDSIQNGDFRYTNSSPDKISVSLPFPGAVTGKSFSVIGQARGMWYFEASFPIDVLDQDGQILAQGYAQAQGEWMTESFVPFKGDIKIPETYIGKATVILHRNNASGLPEHDASVKFDINIEY